MYRTRSFRVHVNTTPIDRDDCVRLMFTKHGEAEGWARMRPSESTPFQAERGEVFMKLAETPFANCFAMLRDRFGTSWMLLHQP